MDARWTIAAALSFALLASPARAQSTTPPELRIEGASPTTSRVAAPTTAPAASSASTSEMALGGIAGGAVGLVGGFYVGAALASDDDADDLDFLSGGVAVATVGEGLLLPLGVHIANGRRGSYMTSALASLGLAAAGLLALEAAHYDPPAAPIILVAVPVAQLAASIAIERATD